VLAKSFLLITVQDGIAGFTMLNVALEDQVKAGLQLYVKHYQDNISMDDILTTSEWVHLCTIRDFLQSFHKATLFL
jgi:hypothetical protein